MISECEFTSFCIKKVTFMKIFQQKDYYFYTKIKKVIKYSSYEKIWAIKSKVDVLRKFVPLNFDNP